jgi:hypothetical protein
MAILIRSTFDDLHNFLDLGLDLAPVLKDGERNVVSDTEIDEVWSYC